VRVFSIPGCTGAVGAEVPYQDLATDDGALRYDAAAGHFALTWKTPRVSGDACYRVTFTTRDGSALHAFVRTSR
jgi:hypothetical protein